MIRSHLDESRELEALSLSTFCKGEELLDLLKQLDVEFSVKDSEQGEIEVNLRIKTVLEQLHQKRKEVNELSKLRELHLEQCIELRQLESDAKQVRSKVSFHFCLLNSLSCVWIIFKVIRMFCSV